MTAPLVERIPKFISEKAHILEAAGVERAKGEIEMILCYLLGCERLHLYLHGETLINEKHIARLDAIIKERVTRKPLQYILQEAWFYGRKFFVSPAVMVPTPETELLCETAIGFVKQKNIKHPKIIDLGVGSGVIAVTLANELPESEVTALDISEEAIDVARKNAADLGASANIRFFQSDYFQRVPDGESFDLILANPPYISEEEYKVLPPEVLADPKVSLTSANDGLGAIEVILQQAPKFLKTGGRIMFEIGYNQAERIIDLTSTDDRFDSIVVIKDLNNIDRVVILSCQ